MTRFQPHLWSPQAVNHHPAGRWQSQHLDPISPLPSSSPPSQELPGGLSPNPTLSPAAPGCRDPSFLGSRPGAQRQMPPRVPLAALQGGTVPKDGGAGAPAGKQDTGCPFWGHVPSYMSQPGAALTWGSGTRLMTSYRPRRGCVTFPNSARPCWGAVWRTHRPSFQLCPHAQRGSLISGYPLPTPASPDLTPEVTMAPVLKALSQGQRLGTACACVCICAPGVALGSALLSLVLNCPL